VNEKNLVAVLKALADATRFAMVQKIAAAGELSCGEVALRFELSQPTISHHLKILTDAGVLTSRAEGKRHHFTVDHALLGAAFASAPDLLAPARKRAATRPRAKRAAT
jgi:ArsR family transcriptional regulator